MWGRSAKHLNLIILPTEKCNFRCVYCYEDFLKGKMPLEVVDSVKSFISSQVNEIGSLRIEFFGGEPLLAYDVIVEILQTAQRLTSAHRIGYGAAITTNGYLLDPKKFTNLVSYGLKKYQITFDGEADYHDGVRAIMGKTPTFERIFRNLILMASTGLEFEVTVRVHVHEGNVDSVRRLVDLISDNLGGDRRYSLFIRSISRLGGPNDEMVKVADRDRVNELKRYTLQKGIAVAELPSDYVCYAADPSSIIIRSDGSISKCTVAFKWDRNHIGRLERGGKLNIDYSKFLFWTRGQLSRDRGELACPLNPTREEVGD